MRQPYIESATALSDIVHDKKLRDDTQHVVTILIEVTWVCFFEKPVREACVKNSYLEQGKTHSPILHRGICARQLCL